MILYADKTSPVLLQAACRMGVCDEDHL